MFFDTPVYFVFLIFVVLLYWSLAWRAQNHLLLAASYFFYGWWDWRFLLLILISTVVDYHCAHFIDRSENPRRRRILGLGVEAIRRELGLICRERAGPRRPA